MYWENVVFNATDPQVLGRFWETALGGETLTDEPGIFETRLTVPDGPVLDLCFQPVPTPPEEQQRLHLDLRGGPEQESVVERLLAAGARHVDIGQGGVPWVVLADPEGNPFCVMEGRPAYDNPSPVAALPLGVADPEQGQDFWQWLIGWEVVEASGLLALRHPSGHGPLLELCAQSGPKGQGRNRMHLDIRLESGDDPRAVAHGITERGGRELPLEVSDLPWRIFADPSGNEFCVLPSRD